MRRPYVITALAGEWVAGRRVKQGNTVLLGAKDNPLLLTDSEAEHELRSGAIAPPLAAADPHEPVKAEIGFAAPAPPRKRRAAKSKP